jgi:Rrf2 family protein
VTTAQVTALAVARLLTPIVVRGAAVKAALKRERYALIALTIMACMPTEPVRVVDVARTENLPPRFLERIFQDLRRAGVLRSVRGRRGGFQLARPLADVSLACVFDALSRTPAARPTAVAASPAMVAFVVLDELHRKRRAVDSRVTLQDLRDAATRLGYGTHGDDFVI